MAEAVHAQRRLFGLPGVVALAQQLPFPGAAFDAAWCLGVLCTTTEKRALLAELRRVLRRDARLGLLVFVADGPLTLPAPEGNSFPSTAETEELLRETGFEVRETADADLGDSPREWQDRAGAVQDEIARRHGRHPAWREAEEQSGRVGRLLSAGELRPWLAVASAR
jgi:SAM-dependent methyltransferase